MKTHKTENKQICKIKKKIAKENIKAHLPNTENNKTQKTIQMQHTAT